MYSSKMIGAVVAAACLSGAVLAAGASAAETTLRLLTAFPKPLVTNEPLTDFLEMVEERGAGVLRIQLLGGPEVTPPPDQPQALRSGVIDMLYWPANYSLGTVPEGDALVGARKSPAEVRENGGWEMLVENFERKMNTRLLSWPGANFNFYIYLAREPQFRPDGLPDLSGLRVRAVPIYRDFLAALGATPVSIHIPEVYTALERGVVQGAPFPLFSVRDVGWDRHLRYRIDPGFFSGDILLGINLNSWRAMPEEARELLQSLALEHEKETEGFFAKLAADEDKALRDGGMTIIELQGEAVERYIATAHDVAWDRLAKVSPTSAKQLRPLFFGE